MRHKILLNFWPHWVPYRALHHLPGLKDGVKDRVGSRVTRVELRVVETVLHAPLYTRNSVTHTSSHSQIDTMGSKEEGGAIHTEQALFSCIILALNIKNILLACPLYRVNLFHCHTCEDSLTHHSHPALQLHYARKTGYTATSF
jgi:hypothetical protein